MAIDRLQELQVCKGRDRAYCQHNGTGRPSPSMSSASTLPPATNATADAVYQETETIKNHIKEIEACTQRIQAMHKSALVEISPQRQAAISQEIDHMMDQASSLIQRTRAQIKGLSDIRSGDPIYRQKQQKALARILMKAVKEYQAIQQTAKQGYRDNLKRQMKIAKPYATEQEIERVLDSGQAGSVFQQEIMSSRVSDQRRMLEQVQGRQNDLEKIVKCLAELHTLMMDMQMLLESQQVMIDSIETNVESAAVAVQSGSQQLTKATEHARSARRKKWILFFIILIVLIIIAVVVYFQVFAGKTTAETATNTAGTSPTAVKKLIKRQLDLLTTASGASARRARF